MSRFSNHSDIDQAEKPFVRPQAALPSWSLFFLGTQMTLAGAQRVLLDQAEWFHQRGYRVTTAFLYDQSGLEQLWQEQYPFPVINLNAWRRAGSLAGNLFRLVVGAARLYTLLRKERVQAVETFTHHANLVGLPVAWAARVKVRVGSHHGRIEKLPSWVNRLHTWVINSTITHRMVAVSHSVQAETLRDGIRADKVTTILNGIKLGDEKPLEPSERTALMEELGVHSGKAVVLSVGRLKQQKGQTHLLDCIPAVLNQHPNVVFLLAGDGPLRSALEEQVARLGIGHAVRFLGMRSDISKLLQLADLFVFPSLWEGLGIAILEAMSAGLPVIATRIGGVNEVITHGQTGLLVPPANPQALGEAILCLLQNPKMRARLGAAGKALIHSRFSLEHMCTGYEALFCDLLEVKK